METCPVTKLEGGDIRSLWEPVPVWARYRFVREADLGEVQRYNFAKFGDVDGELRRTFFECFPGCIGDVMWLRLSRFRISVVQVEQTYDAILDEVDVKFVGVSVGS